MASNGTTRVVIADDHRVVCNRYVGIDITLRKEGEIKNGTFTKIRRSRSPVTASTQKPSGEKHHRQRPATGQPERLPCGAIKLRAANLFIVWGSR
jgi:hypothetical protein